MDFVQAAVAFSFNYVAFDHDDDLFVAANVYDVSTGAAVFVEQVLMPSVALGLYTANYTGGGGKTYLIIAAVYTDEECTVPDTTRAPGAGVYQMLGETVTFLGFCFVAFNQEEDLFVQASIYNVSTGTPVLGDPVEMAHVALGVYFGSVDVEVGQAYEAISAVYTDDSFDTPDEAYAPACVSLQSLTPPVINLLMQQYLTGENLLTQNMRVSIGDSGVFRMRCYASQDVPLNLTGATIVTKIAGVNGAAVELPNDQVTILDQTDPDTEGYYDVSFTPEQSELFKMTPADGPLSDVLATVTQGAEPDEDVITIHWPNSLQVDSNEPRR